MAKAASFFYPYPQVVWHDHYGGDPGTRDKHAWLFRLLTHRVGGVIGVNNQLVEWGRKCLRVPDDKIWYIPNFVVNEELIEETPKLPGEEGYRIVCVANFRPLKDHFSLLKAMVAVIQQVPDNLWIRVKKRCGR